MPDNQRRSNTGGPWRVAALFAVRYGLGGAMILAGIVVLLAVEGDLGAYGFASAVGAGLAVLLLNLMYRMGVSGDLDREREEDARSYFDEHGEWPEDEEAPKHIAERRWIPPDVLATVEQEEPERRRSSAGRSSKRVVQNR